MSKKYDVYDEHGHRIGIAEEQPSAAEQAAGCLLLLYLLRPLYPLLAAIAVVGGIIYAIFAGIHWVSNFAKDTFTPYNSIRVEARAERGGGENNWGWTIFYSLYNQSSQTVDLRLRVKLPVRFYDCLASDDVTVHFQVYSYQPAVIQTRLEPNEKQSGTLSVTYSEEDGRTAGYYMCYQTPGCDSYYGCQRYEIQTPRFFVLRKTRDPIELPVNVLSP